MLRCALRGKQSPTLFNETMPLVQQLWFISFYLHVRCVKLRPSYEGGLRQNKIRLTLGQPSCSRTLMRVPYRALGRPSLRPDQPASSTAGGPSSTSSTRTPPKARPSMGQLRSVCLTASYSLGAKGGVGVGLRGLMTYCLSYLLTYFT